MARNKYPEETIELILTQAMYLFTQKGYDNTSIQDIIDHLGGLSKGAIYHHFKSKEGIFDAVCDKIGTETLLHYDEILHDSSKNGFEKLKQMIISSYDQPNAREMMVLTDRLVSDPKFLMTQLNSTFDHAVPVYIQPVIEQGVKDGSIVTNYPKELAEVMLTLLNIWVNPLFVKGTREEIMKKMDFFDFLMRSMGICIIDEEIKDNVVKLLFRG